MLLESRNDANEYWASASNLFHSFFFWSKSETIVLGNSRFNERLLILYLEAERILIKTRNISEYLRTRLYRFIDYFNLTIYWLEFAHLYVIILLIP